MVKIAMSEIAELAKFDITIKCRSALRCFILLDNRKYETCFIFSFLSKTENAETVSALNSQKLQNLQKM